MKVLVVNPCYFPAFRYGGPIKSVHEMCVKLVEQGTDVTVFTTNADGPDTLAVNLGAETDVCGLKVHYYPVRKPRSYFYSPSLGEALRQNIRRFDLVHINWLYVYPTLIAARECIRQSVPYVLSPRGMLDTNAIEMHGTLKKKMYLRLLEWKHIREAGAVHFTSEGEREGALCRGNIRSVVVPNGIEFSAYQKEASPEIILSRFPELRNKRIALFLGRLNYIKGLDLLMKAWPLVASCMPNSRLVLAGPDNDGYGIRVKEWIRKHKIEDTVLLTGMLSGEAKRSMLGLADVFVAPSYLESFGMSVVEAMACGKPVVITDRVNIWHDVASADAGIVVSCDHEAIAAALTALLTDDIRSQETGARGRHLVEVNYSLDRAAAKMIAMYQSLLHQ